MDSMGRVIAFMPYRHRVVFMTVMRLEDPLMYNIYTPKYVTAELKKENPSTMALVVAASIWGRIVYLQRAGLLGNIDAAIMIGGRWNGFDDLVGMYPDRVLNAFLDGRVTLSIRSMTSLCGVSVKAAKEIVRSGCEPTSRHIDVVSNAIPIEDVSDVVDCERYFTTAALIRGREYRYMRYIFLNRLVIPKEVYTSCLPGNVYFMPTMDDVVTRCGVGIFRSVDIPMNILVAHPEIFEYVSSHLSPEALADAMRMGVKVTKKTAVIYRRNMDLIRGSLTGAQIEDIEMMASMGCYYE